MPLLDWFRGRSAGRPPEGDSRSPEAERMEARRHVQESTSSSPEQAGSTEGAIDEGRDEEAARESGI